MNVMNFGSILQELFLKKKINILKVENETNIYTCIQGISKTENINICLADQGISKTVLEIP